VIIVREARAMPDENATMDTGWMSPAGFQLPCNHNLLRAGGRFALGVMYNMDLQRIKAFSLEAMGAPHTNRKIRSINVYPDNAIL
jgi:hypothetical protein